MCAFALRNDTLHRVALRNFHVTFIVNEKSLRCIALRYVTGCWKSGLMANKYGHAPGTQSRQTTTTRAVVVRSAFSETTQECVAVCVFHYAYR